MAAIARSVRPAIRFLTQKQVSSSIYAKGYADMAFTFAAGNQAFNILNPVLPDYYKRTVKSAHNNSRVLRLAVGPVIDECKIVFYDNADVKQVDVPSFSGSFGILPKHVPTLAVLKPGIVTVFENDGTSKKIFVSSGTVSINEDSSVQVLAEEACPVDQLDAAAAREVLSKAQSELASASTDFAKAEAAIAVEVGEALVKAAE